MSLSDRKSVCTRGLYYCDWHLPLAHDHLALARAHDNLTRIAASAHEIPLMVQLVENTKYRIPGIDLFHGRVELRGHEAIHILPGRGR